MRGGVLIGPDGTPLVPLLESAQSAAERMRGYLGREAPGPGRGLLLAPCAAIHTWFMRFPLDLIFLDREGVVLRVTRNVAPFRFAWGGLRAHGVVEIESGWLPRSAVRVGDRVRFTWSSNAG